MDGVPSIPLIGEGLQGVVTVQSSLEQFLPAFDIHLVQLINIGVPIGVDVLGAVDELSAEPVVIEIEWA